MLMLFNHNLMACDDYDTDNNSKANPKVIASMEGITQDTSQVARVVNFGLATWIDISTSSHMNTRCVRTK